MQSLLCTIPLFMKQSFISQHISKIGVIVLVYSFVLAIYWFLGNTLNVYRFALTGAIFEIFWLPMLVSLIGVPIVSIIFWTIQKFSLRSLYFYSLLVSLLTTLLLVTLKQRATHIFSVAALHTTVHLPKQGLTNRNHHRSPINICSSIGFN